MRQPLNPLARDAYGVGRRNHWQPHETLTSAVHNMYFGTSIVIGTLAIDTYLFHVAPPPLFAHTALVPPLPVIVAVLWVVYLIPLLAVATPTWLLGRKRVDWYRWDYAIVILPFLAWLCIALPFGGPDIESQAPLLGLICSLASILRVGVSRRVDQPVMAVWLLIGLCALAAGLAVVLPDDLEIMFRRLFF